MKKKSTFKERIGCCYQLAGNYITDNPDAILVHGTFNGVRFTKIDFDNGHAWIEENGEVFDLVMNQRFPKDDYYELFHAAAHNKYTQEEASILMLKTEHFGPWNE